MIRVDPSPILFLFLFFYSIRVGPSRSELIRPDFCTCLFRSRARQRGSSQDQVSPYFRVFAFYRLPNAIKVIYDLPVNHL